MVAKFILTGSPKFWKSAAACAIILISTARAARAQTFSSANISNNVASSASYPDLVVDAVGNVNVAWVDSVSGIQFSRSTNAGQSFLPAVAIGGSIGAAFQRQMILDSTATIVEIAWAKPSTAAGAPAGTFDVFVSRSVNGGLAFLPTDTTQVSTAPVVLVDSPRLAFDGAGVDVVWGNQDTWIKRSADALPIRLSLPNTTQDSGGPRIAVDNNRNIFVVWTDRLAQDQSLPGNYCTNQTGTTNGSGIITVYTNTFGGNYYLNETPSGSVPSSNFTRSLSTTDWKGPDPRYPAGYFGCSYDSLHLFFDQNNNLHLLWGDDAPLEDVLTSTAVRQPDGSHKLSFPIGLSGDEGAGSPSVATDSNGSIYFVWSSGAKAPSDTEGIYFSRSDNDGASFFPESTVTSAPGAISPAFPQIAVDPTRNVNIVWEQADQPISATGGNTFHLFFARSTNRGDTFPTVRQVSPSSSAWCIPPSPSGTPPTTPDRTTCGSVQMGVDIEWCVTQFRASAHRYKPAPTGCNQTP